MIFPLVSIIIPSYNSQQYLADSVTSAIHQTYNNVEVILVDDGSTDNTKNLFNQFQSQGVKCFSIENGGASNARNFGLSKATGEYIQFLDADDILDDEKIEKQINAMLKENSDISFTPWTYFKNDLNDLNKDFIFNNLNYTETRTGKEVMISYGMDNWFIPITWLVKSSLLEKAGKWNSKITNNDDGEYFSRVLYFADKVICVDQILYFIRKSESDSLSKINSYDKINSGMQSIQLIKELLEKDRQSILLSYPKRLFHKFFVFTKNEFPDEAKKFAAEFDSLEADTFLRKHKIYWGIIKTFGLYKGQSIYEFLLKIRKTFLLKSS